MGTGQKLWKRAKQVIPGGNMLLSKRAEMFLPDLWPAYFSSAKGCKVWDLDGKARTIEAQDVMAICIQHEMDHLLGKVFVEYLSLLKRDRIKKKMRKAQREDAH